MNAVAGAIALATVVLTILAGIGFMNHPRDAQFVGFWRLDDPQLGRGTIEVRHTGRVFEVQGYDESGTPDSPLYVATRRGDALTFRTQVLRPAWLRLVDANTMDLRLGAVGGPFGVYGTSARLERVTTPAVAFPDSTPSASPPTGP